MTLSVLHVSQPVEGGVARYVRDLVTDQVRRGWIVAVASPPGGTLPRAVKETGAVHVPWIAARAPGPTTFGETLTLARIVKAHAPALVHLHSSKAGLAGRLAIRRTVPTVFQPHGWSFGAVDGPLARAVTIWERRAAEWTNRVLCVSEGERRLGEANGIRARWGVIPNGVDTTAYPLATPAEKNAARSQLSVAATQVVVCVGRLCREKGQDVLLEAWPSVLARVPAAQLFLVGDGPIRERLERTSTRNVYFLGERSDVADWLAAADVIAMPSRLEGMSLTMLEAMARGRSVVASDVPGAYEALNNSGGTVVPKEEPAALAAALVERLLDPALAEAEGRYARRRVEEHYELGKTLAAVAELYEELLSAGAGRSDAGGR